MMSEASAVMNTLNPDTAMYESGILTKSGVPARYLPHSFDNFVVTDKTAKAYEVATEWAALQNPKDRGFALLGAPGVGKTHLAVAAMRQIARLWGLQRLSENGVEIYRDPKTMVEQNMRFINVPIFMDQLRDGIKLNLDFWNSSHYAPPSSFNRLTISLTICTYSSAMGLMFASTVGLIQ